MSLLTRLNGKINSINTWLAVKGTNMFSTMWTFYLFFVWGLLAFIPQLAAYKDIILLISSAWIQLWALPMISVGNAVLSQKIEERAAQDHEMLQQEFTMIKEELALAREDRAMTQTVNDTLSEILERVEKLEEK
jgi:MFS-type transporter involved in bile tolerance (Atg22 family)